jgi:hypothetical protein
MLESLNGLLFDFFDLLCLLVISLRLLLGCLIPISFLGLTFVLDFLDLLRSYTFVRYDETGVGYGLQLVSSLLFEFYGLL